MVRSLGFGFIIFDGIFCSTPFLDLFSLRLQGALPLTQPKTMSRRLILQQASGQAAPKGSQPSHKLIALSFIISFTPLWGFFFTYPSRYFSLLVTQEYLALRGGPRGFTRDFSCPKLLGKFFLFLKRKKNGTFTLYGAGFSCFKFSFFLASCRKIRREAAFLYFPTTLFFSLGRFRFARRY